MAREPSKVRTGLFPLGVLLLALTSACDCLFVGGDPGNRTPVRGFRFLQLDENEEALVIIFGSDWNAMDEPSLQAGLYAVLIRTAGLEQGSPELHFERSSTGASVQLEWPTEQRNGFLTISIDACRSSLRIGASTFDVQPGSILLIALDDAWTPTAQMLPIRFSDEDTPEGLAEMIESHCGENRNDCLFVP